MKIHPATILTLGVLVAGSGALGFMAITSGDSALGVAASDEPAAVAVRVEPVEPGTIRDVRTLSGTLEASSRFIVATEAAGLLDSIDVDISDPIEQGQVIATIDDRRLVQAIAQAEAELAVREAERTRTETRLNVAKAEFERERQLLDDGVSSQSEYDTALASFEASKADRLVADARVSQAQAALQIAQLRLGETRVRADFATPKGVDGSVTAVVSERYQETGNTVGVGDPIIAGVTLDPIRAVVSVTERDYTRVLPGQTVSLELDALPGRVFEGEVTRVSPVFSEASRQARVEIMARNGDGALKPGMFVRVRIVLDEHEAHTIVPTQSVRTREGQSVVFALDNAEGGAARVREIPVTLGIRSNDRIEIREPRIETPVVTLGHQLLDDRSPVKVANETAPVDGGDSP